MTPAQTKTLADVILGMCLGWLSLALLLLLISGCF